MPHSHITIENADKIFISSCEKIVSYCPNEISLLVYAFPHEKIITLIGKNLTMCDLYHGEIKIVGEIESLSFIPHKKDRKEN